MDLFSLIKSKSDIYEIYQLCAQQEYIEQCRNNKNVLCKAFLQVAGYKVNTFFSLYACKLFTELIRISSKYVYPSEPNNLITKHKEYIQMNSEFLVAVNNHGSILLKVFLKSNNYNIKFAKTEEQEAQSIIRQSLSNLAPGQNSPQLRLSNTVKMDTDTLLLPVQIGARLRKKTKTKSLKKSKSLNKLKKSKTKKLRIKKSVRLRRKV